MKVENKGPARATAPVRRRSIAALHAAAPAPVARGISDSVSVLGIPPEEMTERVRAAIMTLLSEMDHMRRDLELAHRKISDLERLADQDPLINISNRRAFLRDMTRMLAYSERYGINSSLLYFDLNDLKQINDAHGHAAGDAALIHFTKTILSSLRDSDIIGRLGGDEFGIILPKASEKDAAAKAGAILERLGESPLLWEGKPIPLNAAYGVYALRAGETPDQALDKADRKMYARKQEHKRADDRAGDARRQDA